MKLKTLLAIAILLLSHSAMAWEHGIDFGYGYGKELNTDYVNKGYFLNLIFYRLPIDSKLDLNLQGSTAFWKAGTATHNKLYTVGLGIGFRAYFTRSGWLSPYIAASVSPSYISTKQFGEKRQGSLFAFQDTVGFGFEVGPQGGHKLEISYMFIHYSNAGFSQPNNGYDIPMVISIGYLF